MATPLFLAPTYTGRHRFAVGLGELAVLHYGLDVLVPDTPVPLDHLQILPCSFRLSRRVRGPPEKAVGLGSWGQQEELGGT